MKITGNSLHLFSLYLVKVASSSISRSTAACASHIQPLCDGDRWRVSTRQDKCSLCEAWRESKCSVLQRCTTDVRSSARHSWNLWVLHFSAGRRTGASGSWNRRAADKFDSRLHSTYTLAIKQSWLTSGWLQNLVSYARKGLSKPN